MYKYVLKRLLMLIPILFGVVFVVQLILYLTPGDVTTIILGAEYTEEHAAQLRAQLGLDQPFIVQYLRYIFDVIRGHLGNSYITGLPVGAQLLARFPNTLKLVAGGMLFCLMFSIPVGIRAAVKPNSFFSTITTAIALIGISLPVFWLGLLLILLFSVNLGWLPSAYDSTSLVSLILPSITLGFAYMAAIMRMTRSSMLESIGQDYVRTARAKGVSQRDVIYRHALKNALLPTITVIGTDIGVLLGGAVVTETVFAVPGIGRFIVDSITRRDTPCVLASVLLMAACVGFMSLVVDLLYAYIDPRIKSLYVAEGGKK